MSVDRFCSHIAQKAFAAALCLAAISVPAAEVQPDNSPLLRRTPADRLRDLSTDRPDLTESPFTVDAGWWQIESDVVAFTRDHDTADGNDTRTRSLSLGSINLKFGLTRNIDLQTVVETYAHERTDDRAAVSRSTRSGFGDITSRLKVNLWGNDGGNTALALMPFVKWPTNRHGLGNDSVEGGLIVPFAFSLPAGWGCGVMTEVDVVRNDADTSYTADWLNTITFARDLTEKLGCYIEFTHLRTRGPVQATFDFGFTFGLGRHVQFDVGANLGLTRATADATVFTGFSRRF